MSHSSSSLMGYIVMFWTLLNSPTVGILTFFFCLYQSCDFVSTCDFGSACLVLLFFKSFSGSGGQAHLGPARHVFMLRMLQLTATYIPVSLSNCSYSFFRNLVCCLSPCHQRFNRSETSLPLPSLFSYLPSSRKGWLICHLKY